ncbi:hypothetical protein D3C84_694430 [compost metagenome]
MVRNELEQAAHSDHREKECSDEAQGENRQVAVLEQVAVLVARVHRGADHGGHRQKERVFGGGLARQAKQQTTDDGRPGTGSTRHHCQALCEPHLQRI